MSVFIIIVVLIVIYAFYKGNDKSSSSQNNSQRYGIKERKFQKQIKKTNDKSTQAKNNEGTEFNPAIVNAKDTPLHPKNNNYNFSGYIKSINWHDTKDGQLQCWLRIVNDKQEKDMNKYIKRDMIGILQQYKAIEVNDYVHVTYALRKGYNNIKKLRVLKK